MKYQRITQALFLDRPNRFIAHVNLEGETVTVHVKNTGRCKELLIPGTVVYLQESDNPNRKTKYDLIAVRKGQTLINMDSQIPNYVAEEWVNAGNLFPREALVRREKKYGNSRFDLYVEYQERKAFIEVKGVTLEVDGEARFPDAPTLRGVKHLQELAECQKDGYEAYLLFVIQMKGIHLFRPNWSTHPEFAKQLIWSREHGVKILAYDCIVTPDTIELDQPIPIEERDTDQGNRKEESTS